MGMRVSQFAAAMLIVGFGFIAVAVAATDVGPEFGCDSGPMDLDDLVGDDARRLRLGEAGRERAAGMTWTSTAAAIVDVYDEARR